MHQVNTISFTIKQSLALTLLTLFITLGLPMRAFAQGPVVLTDEQDEYPLGLNLEILEDPTRQLTIEEVVSSEFDRQFVRNETPELNLGLADSAYWIRFRVSNETSQTGEWWLEIASTDIGNASLYYPRPDGRPGFEMKRAGNAFPVADREIGHYNTVFKLPLNPQSEPMIYLRVEGQRIDLPLTLWSGPGFIRESQKDFMVLGLYWGILFLMASYNFFLFLVLRDKSYLYYVLFMVNLLLAEVLQTRLPQRFLWPNQAWSNTSIIITLPVATLLFIFLLQFAASFLTTKIRAPKLHRIFIGLQIGLGIAAFLFLLWSEIISFLVVWLVLILLSVAAIFITGLVIWWRGYRPARYFVPALAMLLGADFLIILAVLGFLPTSYTEYLGEVGVVLMALLMSLALADRINTIKQEREEAQAEVVRNQQEMLHLKDNFAATLQQKNEELTRNIAEREQAEAKTRQRNRELTLLNQVIAATTAAMESETVLETACRELVQAFRLTQAVAVLANENNSAVRVVVDYQPEGQPSILGQSLSVEGNPLLEYMATHKVPLAVEDAQSDPRMASIRHLLHLRSAVSLLVFPLIVEKKVVGGLSLGSNKPRRFSADELDLVQRVAKQVAGALARIRLVEERQRLEAQYYQAQKMEAIGQLTAGIAHDFNNLLTAIIGFAGLMQYEMAPDDPHQESLNKILHAGQRAANLVRQLLAFSREQVVEPQVLNLNTVVTEMDKMLRRIIGEDVMLETKLAPDLGWTKIDPTQIDQVIINLAVNARDAMPKGGRLTIKTANVVLDKNFKGGHLEVQPGEYVLLVVSDTGHGMNEAVKTRIFEPFYTTKESGKGTGLGLATVFGIVKQNGGNIWIYSEEGIGTTFKIYFPREKKPALQSTRPQVEAESLSGSETILLVEDDEQVRDLTRRVLQKYGYTLLEAQGGREALQLATKHLGPIHLLLTDVIMPDMNGKVLADKLVEIRPDLKVLYMSGYTEDIIVHHIVLDPGVNLLQKPFSAIVLAQKICEVLN